MEFRIKPRELFYQVVEQIREAKPFEKERMTLTTTSLNAKLEVPQTKTDWRIEKVNI